MRAFALGILGAACAGFMALTGAASANVHFVDRWVDVVNRGDTAIYYVSSCPVDFCPGGWSDGELLGPIDIIPVGETVRVYPDYDPDHCRSDFHFVFENGQEVTLWNVNICEPFTVEVAESGIIDVIYV